MYINTLLLVMSRIGVYLAMPFQWALKCSIQDWPSRIKCLTKLTRMTTMTMYIKRQHNFFTIFSSNRSARYLCSKIIRNNVMAEGLNIFRCLEGYNSKFKFRLTFRLFITFPAAELPLPPSRMFIACMWCTTICSQLLHAFRALEVCGCLSPSYT